VQNTDADASSMRSIANNLHGIANNLRFSGLALAWLHKAASTLNGHIFNYDLQMFCNKKQYADSCSLQ